MALKTPEEMLEARRERWRAYLATIPEWRRYGVDRVAGDVENALAILGIILDQNTSGVSEAIRLAELLQRERLGQ